MLFAIEYKMCVCVCADTKTSPCECARVNVRTRKKLVLQILSSLVVRPPNTTNAKNAVNNKNNVP